MTFFKEFDTFDATGLALLVKQKTVSPTELVEAAIERIETRNPAINAVIHTLYDEAMAAATQNTLPEGPFTGVPFLLKDLLADCAGTPMQCGSRLTRERISPADSILVKRVKSAGLNILGKTSTPEFGLSPVTESELSGPTRNPWDTDKTSGGSSGGSAAAVAARMVPMAHAGDGGGSIRIPAAWCGNFGLKVSRGRNPTGSLLIRIWQDMIVEHVITRTTRDSAAMLDILSAPQPGFHPSLSRPERSFLAGLDTPPNPLRIAWSSTPPFPAAVDPEWENATRKAAHLCESLGHYVEEKTPHPFNSEVATAFMIIMGAEIAVSIDVLTASLGKTTHRKDLETLTDLLYESSRHYSARDFAWAVHTLDIAARQLTGFFKKVDVFLTPTLPGPAPKIGAFQPVGFEKPLLNLLRKFPAGFLLRPLIKKMGQISFSKIPFTPLFNISGQPAMSVPLYWDTSGMPIGVQLAAHTGKEGLLLQLARTLEVASPWDDRLPPMLQEQVTPTYNTEASIEAR